MYPLPGSPKWEHLAKLPHNITTATMTLTVKLQCIFITKGTLHFALLQPLSFPPILSLPNPWWLTNLFSISVIFSFWGCYINGTIWYAIFWDWLSWPSIDLWRFMQVAVCINSLILFIVGQYSAAWMYHSLTICLLKGLCVDTFKFWTIMPTSLLVFFN